MNERLRDLAARHAVARERLEEVQARAWRQDRRIERLTAELARLNAEITELTRDRDDQRYWRAYATWQLESVKAGRWHRLGRAFTQRGKGLAAALRGQTRPAVPLRAAPTPQNAGPAQTAIIDVPAVVPPDGPVARPELTVAAILDTFTTNALRYEWRQITGFGPDDWADALAQDRPDLLFCESAWDGNGGRWSKHLSGPPSQELRDLVGWCQAEGVPTVFWNKEDPPNFEFFIETAKLFDWVYTVDADCVPRYRELLGHDRVRVLRFGAQPRIHNPIRIADQGMYDVAFAGTYYTAKHAGRREQMETVVTPALPYGVHIFSRVDHTDPRFTFPAAYLPHVVGSLPYDRMLTAQKLYKVLLNVNTVVDSPTMCARRIFELSAAGLPVLSGPGRAVRETFGDLIPVSDGPEETAALLRILLSGPELRDRQAHLAMRLALTEHTYGHRVDEVLGALGRPAPTREQAVSAVVPTNRPGQISHVIDQVARQTWRPLQLVLVLHGLDLDPEVVADKARHAGIEDVVVLTADQSLSLGGCLNLGIARADGDFIAKMDDDELYGPHYVADLLLPFGYTEADLTGKAAHYVHLSTTGANLLRFPENEHRYVQLVSGGTIFARAGLLRAYPFEDLTRGEDTALLRALHADGVKIYGADRYSFVRIRRDDPGHHTWQITDRELMARGRIAFYGPPDQHVLI